MSAEKKLKETLLKERYVSPLFFLLFLILGLFIYPDYGLSWDAAYARERGIMNFRYIQSQTSDIPEEAKEELRQQWDSYPYHDHGAFFDLIATAAEKIFAAETSREAYLLRHLLIFLFFFTGCIFFYLILRRVTNPYFALPGVLFLILSPRIFAHAFFNPKDIIFMVMCIVALYTSLLVLNKFSFRNVLLHALATAIAIDVRITGLFIPALTLMLFILLFIKNRQHFKSYVMKAGTYLIALFAFVIIFWPYLWDDPVKNFLHALESMSAYNWDDPVLYRGEYIKANLLPWHYLFTWIAISTPLLYLLLFAAGFYVVLKKGITTNDLTEKIGFLLILSYLFAPLCAVIVLNSTLYDGWRQLYFIYPPLLIIAVYGLFSVVKKISTRPAKIILAFGVASVSIYLVYIMMILHPYQHLYFNMLAGKDPEKKYELDYWGLSYRETYEKLPDHIDDEIISFVPANNAGFVNLEILTEAQQQRMKAMPWDTAKYFVTNYRWAEREKVENKIFPYDNEVFTIERCGMKIGGVYKLR